jgi:hypothetical protein
MTLLLTYQNGRGQGDLSNFIVKLHNFLDSGLIKEE